MNWKHVHLIFLRELNDQLRDRRTLFTITILPLLLYPLLGMLMMQMAQFNREHVVRVRVVGAEHWPADQPLLTEEAILAVDTGDERMQRLVEFESKRWPKVSQDRPTSERLAKIQADAREAIRLDETDLVLIVEPRFESTLLARIEQSASEPLEPAQPPQAKAEDQASDHENNNEQTARGNAFPAGDAGEHQAASDDGLHLIANLARDQSQVAQRRIDAILDAWREQWVAEKLELAGINPRLVEPLQLEATDTAHQATKRAMLWSKILPFVMLVWALTGAFYPAIDLCAGEKERGTLETLLSSPARRREIVWGKLFTISLFSVGSALLNLLSMHVTAGIIVRQLAAHGSTQVAEALGPMPIHALGWLVLLLLPMAAFFSALALAVAALARSTKEGQYYLMPLLMITLPLVALPMIPSLELNLGTSLIPVSGAVFLVRSLIEGRYTEALIHLPFVLLVTTCCCSLSLRWAIRQFESEAVMFRDSDRWNLRLWVHQLWRDRGSTASPTEAVLCGVIIIIAMFFAQLMAGAGEFTWGSIVRSTVIVQIGIILAPALLMATLLTRSFRHALRIHRVQPAHLAAAVLLGITMHPSYLLLGNGISKIYEVGEETQMVLAQFQHLVTDQPLWQVLLVLAILPAICEELTFRGLIFGGLLRQQGVLRAIVVSALFFGFTHTVLQQSISASMMGLVLGLIAWRTGGVICTVIVHAINNTLTLTLAWCSANAADLPAALQYAITTTGGDWSYQAEWITLSIVLTFALMLIMIRRDAGTQKVVQAELV